MISAVWTFSDKIGSIAIRDITKSKSSHFAWILDDKLAFQSNFAGVHPIWVNRFLNENAIVWRIDLDKLSLPDEEKLYLEILKHDGQKYDYGAFAYQGLAWAGYRLGLTKPATVNKWGSKHRQLCLELATALEIFDIFVPNLDAMVPDALYHYLSGALKGKLST